MVERCAQQADIANVAAAIGDASRTRILLALAEGRALPPSALAAEAGVATSTMSGHLAKLLDAKLLTMERDGRHRYYRLATPEVAQALEQLARIARPLPPRSLRETTRAQALLRARLCYDHLGGQLGVAVMDALLRRDILALDTRHSHGEGAGEPPPARRDPVYRLTHTGRDELTAFHVDVSDLSKGQAIVRYCIDWAEGRPHLAGPLGGALARRLFDLDWIRRGHARRVVKLTDEGRAGLHRVFGLARDWDHASARSGMSSG